MHPEAGESIALQTDPPIAVQTDSAAEVSPIYFCSGLKVTLREYFGETKSPLVLLIISLRKLFRSGFEFSSDDPPVGSLKGFQVSWEEIPPDVQEKLGPLIGEISQVGFHSPQFHFISDFASRTKYFLVSMPHQDGLALACVHCRIWATPCPAKVYLYPAFISRFSDGTFLTHSGGKFDLASPPEVALKRLAGKDPSTLWKAHLAALDKTRIRKELVRCSTIVETLETAELFQAAHCAFHLKRGVFGARNEAQIQLSKQVAEQETAMPELDRTDVAVLGEIERIQQAKTNWKSSLITLGISIGLFFLIGFARWSWKMLLMLTVILLIHETGHYIAMRFFKYRNLRMFFIPLFGAAVTGQNFNVPGWKKVIVSLSGPAPGIILL